MIVQGWYPDPWGQAGLRWWDGVQWTSWIHDVETRAAGLATQDDAAHRDARRGHRGLAALLGDTARIAVVDVETTGLYRTDRVVEVAVVTVDSSGCIVDEFECLINPLRDPGPTWLHGLTPSILQDAPVFDDVAMHLAALLDGAVVAAHNLPFDRRLLSYEFDRAGVDVDWGDGLDTLRAVRCKLDAACADYGIQLHGAHCALNDARATAQLLIQVADAFEGCRPATAYPLSGDVPRVRTRDGFIADNIERPYLVQLARGVHAAADVAPYLTLLDYAIADLRFDADERRELAVLAEDLGLNEPSRIRAHKELLNTLIDTALDDGVVTDDEFHQLCRAAALLELDDTIVSARTNPYRVVTETLEIRPGIQICFTGSAQWPNGEPLERDELEDHARRHGFEPVKSVTKKNCQLLVAADPASLSGKAQNAQKFGVPVASLNDYFDAVNTGSPMRVSRLPVKGVAQVCTDCGHSWIAARQKSKPVCDYCRGKARPPAGSDGGTGTVSVTSKEVHP